MLFIDKKFIKIVFYRSTYLYYAEWPFIFFIRLTVHFVFGNKTRHFVYEKDFVSNSGVCCICHPRNLNNSVLFFQDSQFQRNITVWGSSFDNCLSVCPSHLKNYVLIIREKNWEDRHWAAHIQNTCIYYQTKRKKKKTNKTFGQKCWWSAISCGLHTIMIRKRLLCKIHENRTHREKVGLHFWKCVTVLNFNEIICDSWNRDNYMQRWVDWYESGCERTRITIWLFKYFTQNFCDSSSSSSLSNNEAWAVRFTSDILCFLSVLFSSFC